MMKCRFFFVCTNYNQNKNGFLPTTIRRDETSCKCAWERKLLELFSAVVRSSFSRMQDDRSIRPSTPGTPDLVSCLLSVYREKY